MVARLTYLVHVRHVEAFLAARVRADARPGAHRSSTRHQLTNAFHFFPVQSDTDSASSENRTGALPMVLRAKQGSPSKSRGCDQALGLDPVPWCDGWQSEHLLITTLSYFQIIRIADVRFTEDGEAASVDVLHVGLLPQKSKRARSSGVMSMRRRKRVWPWNMR